MAFLLLVVLSTFLFISLAQKKAKKPHTNKIVFSTSYRAGSPTFYMFKLRISGSPPALLSWLATQNISIQYFSKRGFTHAVGFVDRRFFHVEQCCTRRQAVQSHCSYAFTSKLYDIPM